MFRKTAWRKAVNDVVSSHQEQALSATMYLLTEFGPTGFLLKEEGEMKNYRVCLGDPHTCTCATFQKEKDLCKHICWILLRRFRLPKDHEYCFQSGLVERQIVEVLQGRHRIVTPRPADSRPLGPPQPKSGEDSGTVMKKAIEEDDICPICQEELLKKRLPVTHCRFGCGNNVHISCMKVWADHQTRCEKDDMVKCPLCREDFISLKLLLEMVKTASKMCTFSERERLDKHLGIQCNKCRVCPIVGQCFKCSVCSYYHLCEVCVISGYHSQHSFLVRTKRNQLWKPVEQSVDHLSNKVKITDRHLNQTPSNSVPDAFNSTLLDAVPQHFLKSLPTTQVHYNSKLLEPGVQCRCCLQNFSLGQQVKTLPCRHQFHAECIETWLQQSSCCPLDWYVVYNPLKNNGNRGKEKSTVHPRIPALQGTQCSDASSAGTLSSHHSEALAQGAQILCIKGTRWETNKSKPQSRPMCGPAGPVSGSAFRRKVKGKTFPGSSSPLTSAFTVRRINKPDQAQQNLTPGLNEHVTNA